MTVTESTARGSRREREEPRGPWEGAARGALAAMAMTGIRRITKGVGLVRDAPPERLARKGFPQIFGRIPAEHRDEAIELAHWAYGAAAGAAYGALPRAIRRQPWTGPAYGLAIWVAFESTVAPALFGAAEVKGRPVTERIAIAADHVLYGAVLSAGSR